MDYTTLICSLPMLISPFNAKITPISRYQLDLRLKTLAHEDKDCLDEIEKLMHWGTENHFYDDNALVNNADRLVQMLKEQSKIDVKEMLLRRLDMRTVVAALRMRAHHQELKISHYRWSFGRYAEHIRRHWHKPFFSLQAHFPWIVPVSQLLNEGSTLDAERLLLKAAWDDLSEASNRMQYDFYAVVVYVLKWNIIHRWTSYDGEIGVQRFNELLEIGLGEYRYGYRK